MQAQQGTAAPPMTTDVQRAPLEVAPAAVAASLPLEADGPAPAVAAAAVPAKKTWREQRWERRRRRIWLEEMLGWILVPIIVIGTYWLVNVVLQGLGTDVTTIVTGIGSLISGRAAP